jgi:hypothetical protein
MYQPIVVAMRNSSGLSSGPRPPEISVMIKGKLKTRVMRLFYFSPITLDVLAEGEETIINFLVFLNVNCVRVMVSALVETKKGRGRG